MPRVSSSFAVGVEQMLYGLVLIVHVIVSLVLMGVILIQGGRGGMAETMAGGTAQSLFGGRTASVLTRMTAGCAVVFMVTCLSLAYLSVARGRSVMDQMPTLDPSALPISPSVSVPLSPLEQATKPAPIPAEPTQDRRAPTTP